jgi:hypothetical protein
MLLFHDRNDAEVPWKRRGCNRFRRWRRARFVTTAGLGHRRILRDERVRRRSGGRS